MPGSGSGDVGNIPELWLWEAIQTATDVDAFPMGVPEGVEPPFVTFGRTGTSRERSTQGGTCTRLGSFEVTIYADTYREAKVLAKAVADALHDFSGTVDDLTIDDVGLEDEADGSPLYLEGRDRPTYSVDQTYRIIWQE